MRGDHLLLKLRLVVGSLICVVVGATTAAPYYAGSYHAAAAAAPSPGSIHKVVQQAHNLQLIPQHAVVDKTAPSIQVHTYIYTHIYTDLYRYRERTGFISPRSHY